MQGESDRQRELLDVESVAGHLLEPGSEPPPGSIKAGDPNKDPAALAEKIWTIHTQRGEFRTFAAPWGDELAGE